MNQTIRPYLSRLEDLFSFSPVDAQTVVARFQEDMRRSLDGRASSLQMLPSYVGRPTGAEQGCFLALDLGGTNLRVLAVRLDGRGKAEITAVNRLAVPESVMRGSGRRSLIFWPRASLFFWKSTGSTANSTGTWPSLFLFPSRRAPSTPECF